MMWTKRITAYQYISVIPYMRMYVEGELELDDVWDILRHYQISRPVCREICNLLNDEYPRQKVIKFNNS